MEQWLVALTNLCLAYFGLLAIWNLIILFNSIRYIRQQYNVFKYGKVEQKILVKNPIPISVVIPAYNEQNSILESIESVLNTNYPVHEIIVVNDGSTDDTLKILIERFDLKIYHPTFQATIKCSPVTNFYRSKKYPQLVVVDKPKFIFKSAADSLNVGLNIVTAPLFAILDADTIIEPEALGAMVYGLMKQSHCISVGGAIYVSNQHQIREGKLLKPSLTKHGIAAFQAIEYLRSFFYGRAGVDNLAGSMCHPGAFTLFETKAAKEVNGFDAYNYAYDTEITLKLHHQARQYNQPTQLHFVPNAIAWTRVPSSLGSYWRQRNRWQRGMLRSVFKHFRMFLNPFYGVVGLVTFPCYVLFEVLSPLVECLSYVLFSISFIYGYIKFSDLAWLILLAWSYITFVSVLTYYLNYITMNIYNRAGDIFRLIWLVTIEMIGFRQFRALCYTWATLSYFIGRLFKRSM